MKKTICIVLFLLGITYIGFAQDKQVNLQDEYTYDAHQGIHLTAAIAGLAGGLNLIYEHQINKKTISGIDVINLRGGGGVWAMWGSEGYHFSAGMSALVSNQNNHFEGSLSVFAFHDQLSYDIALSNANYLNEPKPTRGDHMMFGPNITVGYRYQKPNGKFIFRTGLGFPEGIYVGFGAAF